MHTERRKGLPPDVRSPVVLNGSMKPQLLLVVDTEEEFDWYKPFDRSQTAVSHIDELYRLQNICDRHALTPTYVIDYPVAANAHSAKVMRELAINSGVILGAHLQPWVSPPHEEEVNNYNSYPCNLPLELEARKLAHLLQVIRENIGVQPRIYKAGRYGIAADTIALLGELGLEIDCSTMPGFDLSRDGGPDYRRYPTTPYWLTASDSTRTILEVPTTGGYVGHLANLSSTLLPLAHSRWGSRLGLKSLLSWLYLCQSVRLSPEGFNLKYLQALTRRLHKLGDRIFSLSLHSPSVAVGHTTYARTAAERDRFLQTVHEYIAWFVQDFGGEPSSHLAVLEMCQGSRTPAA